jgi:hypothetical protein
MQTDQKAACATLPPLPVTSQSEARLWFSSNEIRAFRRARARQGELYLAANPPLRVDWPGRNFCLLPPPASQRETVEDILAPAGSDAVIIVYGTSEAARRIEVSNDKGRTWTRARDAGLPSLAPSSLPSAIEGFASSAGRMGRMFATYGGSTLDVSENGGLDWSRQIEGAAVPAQGFAIDFAGDTLWYVAAAALDRVAAFWIPLSDPGPLPREWNIERLPDWDANGVYSAQADPFDSHGLYLGGQGRLGHLRRAGKQVTVDVRWNVPPSATGELYTYVTAIWVDPKRSGHVVWGGGQQGGGPAQVLESMDGGKAPRPVPLSGRPAGVVRAIQPSPDDSKLLLFLEREPDTALAIYVIDR